MSDNNTIVRDRQLVVRREMDRRGISLKAVAFDSGIPYPTIISYFPGEKDRAPATINAAAIFSLCAGNALPLDLMSLLLPEGFQIVRASEEIDHDTLEDLARDYLGCKGKAHHPDSPAGRDLAPSEIVALNSKATSLRAVGA